jgi:hypothetical protein
VIEFFKLGIQSYHHGFDIRQPFEVHTEAHWQLVSQFTLQESVHLSLVERAQMFKNRFGL